MAYSITKNPFILLSDHYIQEMIDSAGINPKLALTSQYDITIMAMVEHHLGLSVLPKLSFLGRGRAYGPGNMRCP